MNLSAQKFPFVSREPGPGAASLAPMLPLTIAADQNVSELGLLDTGAGVNVLPYAVGVRLGFAWNMQTTPVQLSGNLESVEARVVTVSAVVASFPAVRLAFAWAKTDSVSVILGQVNFFMEFDVCFFRSLSVFEVRPKQTP